MTPHKQSSVPVSVTEPALLPADSEIEQAVLGCLLIDPGKISDIAASLKPEHFYEQRNAWIYEEILKLDRAGEPVDLLTVTYELEVSGRLEDVGGMYYVMGLTGVAETAAHVEHYAEMMLRLASDRAVIRIAGQAANLAFTGKGEALQYLAQATEREQAGYLGGDDGPVWLDDVTDSVISEARELVERRARGEIVDLLTPWQPLNDIIIGLLPGDYVVLTAPPSIGKSTVVHQIIDFSAKSGHGNLFITTETTAKSVAARQIGKTFQVSPRLIRSGGVTEKGIERLISEKDAAKIGPVLIDDKITSFDQIERCILQAKRSLEAKGFRLRLVVVDFLHQLTKPGHDSTVEELGAISYGLRRLAGKYDLTLIAVSEVDKASYATGGKAGSKNASGSAKIHYSAVLGWVLNKNNDGSVELTVDKNKDGPTGKLLLPPMTKNTPWFG